MRSLTRPATPGGLITAAAKELNKAKGHFVDNGRINDFKFKAYSRSDVKKALGVMSQMNCAYCEANYDATSPVDVEHYRPKGGVEINGALTQPGYWWLAADWNNLLPSCIRCNRVENLPLYDGTQVKMGKGNHFPLANEAARAKQVGEEANEIPLLIDPSDGTSAELISFKVEGNHCLAVESDPDSTSLDAIRARCSIDTYGLNRSGLVEDRSRSRASAQLALAQIELSTRLLDSLGTDDPEIAAGLDQSIAMHLKHLRELTSGSGPYSGMITRFVAPALAKLNIQL